jgi:hypothetical protein
MLSFLSKIPNGITTLQGTKKIFKRFNNKGNPGISAKVTKSL